MLRERRNEKRKVKTPPKKQSNRKEGFGEDIRPSFSKQSTVEMLLIDLLLVFYVFSCFSCLGFAYLFQNQSFNLRVLCFLTFAQTSEKCCLPRAVFF